METKIITHDEMHDLLFEVCREYGSRLNGITYGSVYSFDNECFMLTIRYSYYCADSNTYSEKIPGYLFGFNKESAKAKVDVILRNLITRSFRTEVNHIFGKDFNPL